MRLHSLAVSAFGPFAGTAVLDFDDVARDGLFLLWGPTGAGKTTLINRIVEESGQRILVIQNELGEVTVEGAPVISTDEEIFDMDDGLVCGTVRGDHSL